MEATDDATVVGMPVVAVTASEYLVAVVAVEKEVWVPVHVVVLRPPLRGGLSDVESFAVVVAEEESDDDDDDACIRLCHSCQSLMVCGNEEESGPPKRPSCQNADSLIVTNSNAKMPHRRAGSDEPQQHFDAREEERTTEAAPALLPLEER